MVVTESEIESPLQSDEQQQKNNAFQSLGRQLSIYSLTLDEFQHTLCESGKNFGSMNMDEFLNSIWTAEENQAQTQTQATNAVGTNAAIHSKSLHFSLGESTSAEIGIARQPSLPRQGSLTLPAPLCQKTVDEVWSEIKKTEHEQIQSSSSEDHNANSTQREPTFGEMTLEDFLVRAGVVREQCQPRRPPLPQSYGLYPGGNNPATVAANFVARPIVGLHGGGAAAAAATTGGVGVAAYQAIPQPGIGEASGYVGGGKRSGGYAPPAVGYGGRVGNGGAGGGYTAMQGLGMGSPVSPVSSDGLCTNQVDGANQYGLDMRGGRKRIIDGPVEKVVERRQRRMIKNRESAARSRARKQAYTVELEAELNQLKEENAQLKQALEELDKQLKQQYLKEERMKAQTRFEKAKEQSRRMRRSRSCPY